VGQASLLGVYFDSAQKWRRVVADGLAEDDVNVL